MKTNLKYAVYDLITPVLLAPLCLSGLIILIADKNWLSVFLGIVLCLDLFMLSEAIKNIQWFDIKNGNITVYSPFGVIKRVPLTQIKKAFVTNAEIWGYKGISIRRPHIVLCLTKSIRHTEIENPYNRKKRKYIILPYTAQTEHMIQTEYREITQRELFYEQKSNR